MRFLKVQLRDEDRVLLETEGQTTLTPEELLGLLPRLLGLQHPAPDPAPLATRKYAPLAELLRDSEAARVSLTFDDIEELLGFPLPASARKHRAWWSNSTTGHSQAAAWLNEGWRVAGIGDSTVTFQREKGEIMRITGRIGGRTSGYDLNLTWAAPELRGRIGGRLAGRDVQLQIVNGEVTGRVGGRLEGFDVRGTLAPQRIEARLGGETIGQDLRVALSSSSATGRLGGPALGMDLHLALGDGGVSGRIGGQFEGKDVTLTGNAPAEVAVLAAAIAYKALEDDSSAGAAAS